MITETMARTAKQKDKTYTISDVRGLRLEVRPTGRKFWRLRYIFDGKRNWYTIGEYPAITIDQARESAAELQQRLKDGLPLVEQKPEAEAEAGPDLRFAAVAADWLRYNDTRPVVDKYKRRTRSDLNRYVLPILGERDIRKITPEDVLGVIQRIADEGKYSCVAPVRVSISQIFRFAAANGHVTYDPCAMIRREVSVPPGKHHPSLTDPYEIGGLLRDINRIGRKHIRLGLSLLLYSFCRHVEARRAEWSEVDFEREEWRIPAEKMKKRRPHIVPLSSQLVEIFEAMRSLSGRGQYVFPGFFQNGANKPMCDMPFRAALVKIGYPSTRVTIHGFRGMASTILNANGFNSDWIERQLAHVEGNRVRASYNHADYLDDRRRMVQWYGDYLDELRGEPLDLTTDTRWGRW